MGNRINDVFSGKGGIGIPYMPGMSEEEYKKMLCNPVYTGIGVHPEIVTQAQWVKAAKRMIEQIGVTKFLNTMLNALRESLDDPGHVYGYKAIDE